MRICDQFTFLLDSLLPFEPLDVDTPKRVEGPLRLATKYEVDELRQRIIKHLENDWPNSLSGWDDLLYRHKERFGDEYKLNASTIVELARTCDIPSVLPAAFYYLNLQMRKNDVPLNRDTMEFLLRVRLKMRNWISSTGTGQLRIQHWDCSQEHCRYQAALRWISVQQRIFHSEDPLKVLCEISEELVKEDDDEDEEDYFNFYGVRPDYGKWEHYDEEGEKEAEKWGWDFDPTEARMACRLKMAGLIDKYRELVFNSVQFWIRP